jgi:2-phospho-L-lactate guanylyltransferase
LSDDERYQLNVSMLTNTINVLRELPQLEQVLVVSRDTEALAIARELGARTVAEAGQPALNDAITRATEAARQFNARGVLVVPADIPHLNAGDLGLVIAKAKYPPVVVVSPDRHEDGTNALLVMPAGFIDYHYGPDSYSRHIAAAKAAGARVEVVETPTLSFDLDVPEDLPFYERAQFDNSPLVQSIASGKFSLNGRHPESQPHPENPSSVA